MEPREKVTAVLWSLYHTSQLKFSSKDYLFSVIQSYEDGQCDFADYLILQDAKKRRCRALYTFDKKFALEAGVELV